MDHYIAIDYGSKLAGTTVICHLKNEQLTLLQSEKKKDADQFIINYCTENFIKKVFIDAPLSLPAAYFSKGEDYFYRAADKYLKAMSPMFLGGLTARAIKLAAELSEKIQFFEVYPGATIRNNALLSSLYNKKNTPNEKLIKALKSIVPYSFEIKNLHQFDAVIAWDIAHRYQLGTANRVGDISEGQIYY